MIKVLLNLKKEGKKYLIVPIPQSSYYHVIKSVTLSQKPFLTTQDKKWGSVYSIFRLNDVIDSVSISLQIEQNIVSKKIPENMMLTDYHLLKKNYYLTSNRFVNGSDPMIKKISSSIFNKKKSVNSNTKILYNYVLRLLTYGNPIKGLYSYKDALKYKIVDCGGFATLFLSLLQSIHIPSRLVVGFLTKNTRVSSLLNIVHPINFNSLFMHVWTEMLLPNNTWFPMDPAIEWRRRMGKSRREGGFGYIPNDRIVFSYGEDFAIRIHDTIYTVDLLQYPAYLK